MRIFYFLVLFCFSSFLCFAQVTSGSSGTGANINVDNYQIWWRINPDSATKSMKGVVTIKFRTTVANVSNITLDLSSAMTISNTKFRGATVVATRAGNTFTVPLGTTIATIGTRDSITVSYSGTPPDATAGGIGYQKGTDPAVTAAQVTTNGFPAYRQTTGAGNYVWTLAESYEDRDWWPCKADMQDKADTLDITVNVPWRTNNANAALATDTFWVATNGRLVDSSFDITAPQASRNRTFVFQNRYPMTSYLVSVCVARFNRYYRGIINIGGFNTPVVYYLFAGKNNYSGVLTAMDKVTELVQAFGNKFGNYGFMDPVRGGKHGFYEGLGSFGGMEHQTFSGIATDFLTSTKLLTHELAHQWFGDKISFATWNHLWLAEGFAEYLVAVAPELVTGMGYTAFSERSSIKTKSLQQRASVFIPNTNMTNSDLIWAGATADVKYGSSVYDRGAMVISMLRTMCGDTKFYNVLKDYQNSPNLAYKSATTDTLKKRFADTLGVNLDEFFNDNVIGTGYPNYNILQQVAGPSNKTLLLSVGSQTRRRGNPSTGTVSSVAYFNSPIVVHVKGASAGQDTTIVFYDGGGGSLRKAGNGMGAAISGNLLSYQLSFTPTQFFYDDSARTMSTGTITASTVLDLKLLDFKVKQHATFNDASLILDDNSINSAIILERSADGVVFEEIGNMVLQASTSTTKKYLFNDMKPLELDNYYRAKYKNAEGIYLYSKIVKVGFTKNISFTIINNPVQQNLQVKTTDAVGKDIVFTIFDAAGRQVKTSPIKNASSITELSVAELHAGIYILKITTGNEEAQNLKFLIK